ncbi:MAG: type IV pilus assembly protein PilM [Deltaproteobacteria bacterium]|nr:type IV pilus assembly protein PilM [Deltaproteobacteria bacterium]
MFKRPLIAIDVGSSAIKVAELAGGKQKKLTTLGLETLPLGAVVDGVVQDNLIVEQKLKELLRKLKIRPRGRRASFCVSGSAVLIKRLEIEAKEGSELAEQVYFEAEQQFQADMSDIYLDFFVLGKAKDGNAQSVLVVGARRETVEQYITILHRIGMRAGVVECDAFSIANMFEHNYGKIDGLSAILKIGASASQVLLMQGGEYVYTGDVPMGGEEYTRRIAEALGVDRENAEALKIAASSGSGNLPPEAGKAIAELNDHLVADVQVAIDYFVQGAGGGAVVSSVFLTGGGSRILGLDAAIAAAMHVPVQIINPFQQINIDAKKFKMEQLLNQGAVYGVTIGLGLRSMGDQA